MRLHVMDTQNRALQCPAQARCHGSPNQQGTGKPGAAGIGDAVNVRPGYSRLDKRGINQGQHSPDVITRSELRHDTAVDGMHVSLTVELMSQQPLVGTVERNTCLVAGAFDTKDNHVG